MGTALLEVLRGAHLLPMWAKKGLVASIPLTGDRLVDTAMLSNLGPMDQPPSFGPGAPGVASGQRRPWRTSTPGRVCPWIA